MTDVPALYNPQPTPYHLSHPRTPCVYTVRISKQKNKMSRGYGPQFQNEQFFIHKVLDHLPQPLYVLKSISKPEDPIEGKFYESEITKVTNH